jgi:hypothetical protein
VPLSLQEQVGAGGNPAPRSFVLTLISLKTKLSGPGWHVVSWNLEGDSHESIVALRCGSSCRGHVDCTR